ncbi:glycogen debranching protein [Christiangramia fulva]|uniref:Glycogen debranching protein n=1 Tax=Christiangramia fulva TaxID=2126553 RepID=A0A2R3Z769_9FLAO|nr:glycogen debranching protein [Christiangramia fulva]AVR46121.1 glycogen debranching protein [Christiangramia fulva]
MKNILSYFLLFCITICNAQNSPSFEELLKDVSSIEGKQEYLKSPFVTAGRRTYMVGFQDGSFPEIGWHIKGEMGGVWNHPIKLFDGFAAEIISEKDTIRLDKADSFTNYPIASKQNYKFPEKEIEVERWQFIPDENQGFVFQYIIHNYSKKAKKLHFNLKGFSDLRPTWLGERTNMNDGPDKANFNTKTNYVVFRDSLNPWFATMGSDQKPRAYKEISSAYGGKGTGFLLDFEIEIPANQSEKINFFGSGSYKSVAEASENYRDIRKNLIQEILSKKEKYQGLAARSKLTIPDKKIQQLFEWLKYNSEWLVQEVPEIGTGITAGIPDYPWWFGVDSEYALKGYMAVGQEEAVNKTIRLLDSVSMAVNGNGRIIHEMSTNGAVFNKGNINETPQFASLIWEIYKWNGDKHFLQKYFPTIKKGLEWLLQENDKNGNLFPDGFGMMEIHGLDSEMIDVAAYTQRAFADAAKIAAELEQDSLKTEYSQLAETLRKKINSQFWSEEFNSYADFIGTDEQALKLIDDAIVRADTLNKPWSVKELRQIKKYIQENPSSEPRPFVLHHNWVVNTPMEMKIADSAKAIKALKTAEIYTNPFGVFVTGIDRDESSENGDGSFKGSKSFSYTGAVMTLPTGVQAVAENNYGHPDKALEYLKKMSRSFSYAFPGSMYEVSPDYGMITQAWTIYSFAIPIIQQFFGIQPMASEKTISIRPQMPLEWENASLENVKVAGNSVSVIYSKENGQLSLKIVQTQPDWKLKIILPKGYYEVKGNLISEEKNKNMTFQMSGKEIEIKEKL